MSVKSLFSLFFLIVIVLAPISAATVSFLVIETGVSEEKPAYQYSGLWESGLMDVFFEAGHIVSNASMMRLEYRPDAGFPVEAQKDMEDALEGGVDFFIIALLDYNNPEASALRAQNISLRIFKTNPLLLIYEGQYSDTRSKTTQEEYDSLRQAVRGIVPRIN